MAELSPAHKLALEISSCPQACVGLKDLNHPCNGVISWQAQAWNPPIQEIQGSLMHRPEAWTGDLVKAPIIFLASNPSFDPKENYPSWDNSLWSDEDIAAFGAERFTEDKFRKFGVTESRSLAGQDRTIALDGTYSDQVQHWVWVRKYVSHILGKNAEDTSAIDDYVMTELVHCKSPSEEGVMDALDMCSDQWFEKIMAQSPAKLIFIAGAKAGEAFARIYKDELPSDWGCWASSKVERGKGFWPKSKAVLDASIKNGAWDLQAQKRNSVEIEIAGKKRLAIYISRRSQGGPIYAPWLHTDLIHPDLIQYWRDYLAH